MKHQERTLKTKDRRKIMARLYALHLRVREIEDHLGRLEEAVIHHQPLLGEPLSIPEPFDELAEELAV